MWIIFALSGAVANAYTAYFRKKLDRSISTHAFLWLMYGMSFLILLPFTFIFHVDLITLFAKQGHLMLLTAILLNAGAFMNVEALKRGELSYVAPLNAFIPVFTLLFAWPLIGEMPPAAGIVGVSIVFIGAYIINLESAKNKWYIPLVKMTKNTAAILSLGMAVAYALNSITVKVVSNAGFDSLTILVGMITINWLVLCYVPFVYKSELKFAFQKQPIITLLAALAWVGSALFHFLAVAAIYTSYAISVRRLDSLISVFLGWKHLNESKIAIKLLGASVMTIGVIVLAFG